MSSRFLGAVVGLSLSFCVFPASAFDVTAYEEVVKETIRSVVSGNPNVDELITQQKKLVELGVAACREHGEKHVKDSKFMGLVADNAKKMMGMSLDEIEEQWHEQEFLLSHGIDTEVEGHFSKANSLADAVIHPATAYIALNEYKKTNDSTLLIQVKEELEEVLEHLEHIH